MPSSWRLGGAAAVRVCCNVCSPVWLRGPKLLLRQSTQRAEQATPGRRRARCILVPARPYGSPPVQQRVTEGTHLPRALFRTRVQQGAEFLLPRPGHSQDRPRASSPAPQRCEVVSTSRAPRQIHIGAAAVADYHCPDPVLGRRRYRVAENGRTAAAIHVEECQLPSDRYPGPGKRAHFVPSRGTVKARAASASKGPGVPRECWSTNKPANSD